MALTNMHSDLRSNPFYIQNCVSALRSETMHSPKTALGCEKTPNLASTCMHSRAMVLLASKGLVNHGDIRLIACSCLWMNVRDLLAPLLSNNNTGSILWWHSNIDTPFNMFVWITLCWNMLKGKRHVTRQTPPSAPPNKFAVAVF